MKIGLCGTVSVGKSTLVKELSKLPQFKDYTTATERSKYLRDLGVKLNTDSTIQGQFLFANERNLELLNDNLITDRTMWDVSAFTLSAKSIPFFDRKVLVESFMLLKDEYDWVIYVDPIGVPIEDNGVRCIDVEYRDKIDVVIKELLVEFKPKNLLKIQGTTEERIKQIVETIFP